MADAMIYDKPPCMPPADHGCETSPGDSSVVLPSVMMSRCADLVRTILSDPANIWHPQLRSMIYKPDIKETRVAVMMGFSTTPDTEQADVFPRVVVLANETYFGDLDPVTDGLFTNSGSPAGEVFGMDDGMSHHSGNILFSCLSSNALESLLLAESLVMYFIENKNHIREDMRLSSFDVRSIKGPRAVEKPQGINETIVAAKWSSGMAWSTVRDAPALADAGLR